MPTYLYPSNRTLREIAQVKSPTLELNDPIFEFFPIENVDADIIEWEQYDDYVGLQEVRGLDGKPSRVTKTGAKSYMMRPGKYGEFMVISESDLTKLRPLGSTDADPISVESLVMKRQDQLLSRRIDRIRYLLWTLLIAGTFSVSNGVGVEHTDSYTVQTASFSAWGTPASGTPLLDLRGVPQLARAKGCDFGGRAKAFMNRITANKLLNNANSADLAGKRHSGGNSFNSLADMNRIFLDNDLPQVVIMDDVYINSSGTVVPFIADNKTVIVGKRLDGSRVGAYAMTRNANNEGCAPGAYMKVINKTDTGVPAEIEIHDGHNGGPIIEYPSNIVVGTNT